VLRTIGNYPRRKPTSEFHREFTIPYVYDFFTKLCRNRQKTTKTTIMKMFLILGKAKLSTGNINGLNLAAVRLINAPVLKWPPFKISTIFCTKHGLIKACE
jgi:hypothetical protein